MAVLNSETILRRRPDLIATRMGDEAVMLDIESGYYFGLSGVGPHIWNMLEQSCSAGGVVDSVKAAFAVGADDDVHQDVITFMQRLVDKGLVLVVD